jgi:hypothetical protein
LGAGRLGVLEAAWPSLAKSHFLMSTNLILDFSIFMKTVLEVLGYGCSPGQNRVF